MAAMTQNSTLPTRSSFAPATPNPGIVPSHSGPGEAAEHNAEEVKQMLERLDVMYCGNMEAMEANLLQLSQTLDQLQNTTKRLISITNLANQVTDSSSSSLVALDDQNRSQHQAETNHGVGHAGMDMSANANMNVNALMEMKDVNKEEIIEEEVLESIEPADVGDNHQGSDGPQDQNAISFEEDLI